MDVELGPFFEGIACGGKVSDAHHNVEFANQEQRFAFFWFAAGMLATGEYGITTLGNENAEFIAGLATQAPSFIDESNEELMTP